MGLLGRLLGSRTAPGLDMNFRAWPQPADVVRGEERCRDTFLGMFGPPREEGHLHLVVVDLVREPGNPVDPNAIRAVVDGQMLGYVRRELAELWAPYIDRARRGVSVYGVVRGGSSHQRSKVSGYGLHLWGDRGPSGRTGLPEIPGELVTQRKWPPFAWEGIEPPRTCPDCSMELYVEPIGGGQWACERCGRVWRPRKKRSTS